MNDRNRLKLLTISHQLLMQVLKEGFGPATVESDALPPDTVIVHATATERGDVRLTLWSASFDPVEHGTRIPEIMPTYRNAEPPTP